jgi:hypothetical protein
MKSYKFKLNVHSKHTVQTQAALKSLLIARKPLAMLRFSRRIQRTEI